jgi:hypothetical protein
MSSEGRWPYIDVNTNAALKERKMTTTTKLIKSLLIAALLASASAHAADDRIVIAIEDGKQIASFKVGNSNCVLKDGQIRCALGK